MKRVWRSAATVRFLVAGITAVFVVGAASIELLAEETAFSPPPRKIDDVVALLDNAEIADKGEYKRFLAEAGEDPTEDALKADLAKFYFGRGKAAGEVGNITQQLEDLREAVRLVEEANLRSARFNSRLYLTLAWAELSVGKYLSALRAAEKGHKAQARGGTYRTLVVMNAWIGNFEAASRWRQKAKDNIRVTGRWGNWGKYNLSRLEGVWLEAQGRWREAEIFQRQAVKALIEIGEEQQSPTMLPGTRLNVAGTLLHQGRAVEAEVAAREALTLSLERFGKYGHVTAYALRRLAQTLLAQGRYGEAETIGRVALAIYQRMEAPEDSAVVSLVRLGLANSLAAQGDWDGALVQFDTAQEHLVENSVLYEKWYAGNPTRIIALVTGGRAAEAIEPAGRALENQEARLGEKHYETAEVRGVLAMALAATGKVERALDEFASSVEILLSRSRRSDGENVDQAVRDKRLEAILEAYIGLLSRIVVTPAAAAAGVDPVSESFRLADVVRGQAVQRAIAANAARGAARDPALAELVREEQDARRQISALFGLIAKVMSSDPEERDPDAIEQIRTRIGELRERRAEIMTSIESDFPDYADLINPKPATVDDVRALLHEGEALIAYYFGADTAYAWAVPKTGQVAFAAAPMGLSKVETLVGALRRALDPRAATLGDIPDYNLRIGHRLFETLLKPVESAWQDARNLIVVADGPLGYLPLSVLPTEAVDPPSDGDLLFSGYRSVPWLARTHAITVLPSTGALKTLRRTAARSRERDPFVGFGDPVFSPSAGDRDETETAALASRGVLDLRGMPIELRSLPATGAFVSANLSVLPRLPDTADEVRDIAAALHADPARDVFIGRDANETRVKTMDLNGYKVLAFATHGLVPGDLDGLSQPALALSAPETPSARDDGLLTMGEILELDLDADWIVLSACNTSAGAGAGAEAISGLGRAFFYAGSRALLVSNWPVETTSARMLTTDLFRRQADDPSIERSEALRQASMALVDGPGFIDPTSGESLFSYAHPIFWAPFSLIGDGG